MKALKKTIKNNKGMSILELLMVMAISAMMLTLFLISFNVVNNANVNKAAKRMENVLKTARVAAMARGREAGVVNFLVEDGKVYAYTATGTGDEKKELICNANVVVSVGSGGVAPAIADASTSATVAFNPNGRIRDALTTGDYFLLSKGTKVFKVVVYKETGHVECGIYTPVEESPE